MSLIDDIAEKLQSESVGTVGSTIFKSYLPDNLESYNATLAVLDTGGSKPSIDVPTKEPTFQVFIRAINYVAGKALLDSVRSTLHQTRNTTLGNTFFYFIYAISEGGHIGRNEAGQDEFSINFACRTR